MTTQHSDWYASLQHEGLLISPTRREEFFSDELPDLPAGVLSTLRTQIAAVQSGDETKVTALLDTIFRDVLGYTDIGGSFLTKRHDVAAAWRKILLGNRPLSPDWAWVYGQPPHLSSLPIFIARPGKFGIQKDEDWTNKRLGIGRGKRAISQILEWMRHPEHEIQVPLAVLTNGREIRLIHAGLDYQAWVQWDIDFFLEAGGSGRQLTALRHLLGRPSIQRGVENDPGAPSRLVRAIHASRQGQAELSSALGERLRQAVELLIHSTDADALSQLADDPNITEQDIYRAACRIIMRLVVILFAESRDLLDRQHEIYYNSYSLQGLRVHLERAAAGNPQRLRNRYSAWPRLLALFNLVYSGSPHERLPVHAYGGGLFQPGDPQSDDPIRRIIATFEDANSGPSDAVIHKLLQFLTRSRVRIRQGRQYTWVDEPVDFSSLSTEYIGIIYEGLLDFELKRVTDETGPMIMLPIGDEPVLPFAQLEGMDKKALKSLFSSLAKTSSSTIKLTEDPDDDDEFLEPPAEEEDSDDSLDDAEDDDQDDQDDQDDDTLDADERNRATHEAVFAWAKQTVVAAGIVKPPRNAKNPQDWSWEFNQKVTKAAKKLVPSNRLLMPGTWYLARWGGTRKGSGTFYTRPQLAIPTVHRTLEPLAFERSESEGKTLLTPKTPEEILALKVCDPAMGSGSFPVAALRYLTDALYQSLVHHNRLQDDGEQVFIRIADGRQMQNLSDEGLPFRPEDDKFEEHLRTRLKRYVVEHSIYGVDLDPLAVELAKMALWIETMDPNLPFGFIDHKIKCGNSLIGCWFDQFEHYPALALERSQWDGGDKNHKGVHFKKHRIGKALQTCRNDRIKPELRKVIQTNTPLPLLSYAGEEVEAGSTFHEAGELLEALHQLPVHLSRERAQRYREEILEDPNYIAIRQAFDIWCAIWFWPFEELDHIPSPKSWRQPTAETLEILEKLVEEHRFFHWELEFPDVFNPRRQTDGLAGFDAILGNPPWEISKPNSKEFFSNIDPLYRSYGKQEALRRQRALFDIDINVEERWLHYNAGFKSASNFFKNRAHPYGDGKEALGGKGESLYLGSKSDDLHRLWQHQREDTISFADREHPFQYQGGGDINTYKLFLEMGHALLRQEGRMGFIVPSGVYTDLGTTALRELFLDRCRWRWLFGFENRNGIFDIHRSFKFCPIIIEKGGQTDSLRAAFMHRDLADWEDADAHVLDYPAARIHQFSPNSKSILELRSEKDLQILEKIYDNGVLLGDESEEGWGIKYAREFDMTNDSDLFRPRPKWEEEGYISDEYGHWLKGPWKPIAQFGFDPQKHRLDPQYHHWSILDRPKGVVLSRDGQLAMDITHVEDVALPLYEGRMVGQFDFSEKGWVSGKGRSAVWRDIPWENKVIEPQYLMALNTYYSTDLNPNELKLAFMDITASTNMRTAIAAVIPSFPAGNSAPILSPKLSSLALVSAMNSFAYDYQARKRCGGLHLNYFVIAETALPSAIEGFSQFTKNIARSLSMPSKRDARSWTSLINKTQKPWYYHWAVQKQERLRKRIHNDVLLSTYYGVGCSDLKHLLTQCDHPKARSTNNNFTRKLDPKGFWRVDRDKDPELRHTVLAQVAFQDLQKLVRFCDGDRDRALAIFCGMATAEQIGDPTTLRQQNPHIDPDEGWLIPQTLRLADYGLGHDERAQQPQPVASRLGPRFYDWQLTQDPTESWQECHRHAELLEMIVPTTPTPTPKPAPDKPNTQLNMDLLES